MIEIVFLEYGVTPPHYGEPAVFNTFVGNVSFEGKTVLIDKAAIVVVPEEYSLYEVASGGPYTGHTLLEVCCPITTHKSNVLIRIKCDQTAWSMIHGIY